MSEPVGGGWAAPGARPPASPAPVPPAPESEQPQPSPQPAAPQQAPAWQGQPGWGAPAPAAPQGWGAPPTAASPGWGGPPTGTPQGWAGAQPGWGAPPPQAPRPGVVPLRPLGLGELLDGAVALVRSYPRPTLTVSALVAATSTVLQVLLLLTALRPLFEVDALALEAGDTEQLVGLLAGAGAAGAVTGLFGLVTSAVMNGLMAVVASRGVLGRPLTLGELWAAVRRRLGRLVGGALLVPLVVAAPLLLAALVAGLLSAAAGTAGLVVGVPVLGAGVALAALGFVRLAFVPAVVVLEDARVLAALRRSWRLVKGGTWRVLGVLLLAALVGGVVTQVLQFPLALLGGGGPFALDASSGLSTSSLLLTTIGAGLAAVVVAPFTAGVAALLYVDRRMRAEALDVALQAAAAEQR